MKNLTFRGLVGVSRREELGPAKPKRVSEARREKLPPYGDELGCKVAVAGLMIPSHSGTPERGLYSGRAWVG
jgi:hypothetical protein